MSRLAQAILLAFAACAIAAKPSGPEVCVASCVYSLQKVNFTAPSPKGQAACTNPLRIKSTYYCAATHCDEPDIGPGIAWWADSCKNSTKLVNEDKYRTAIANTTQGFLSSLPAVDLKHKGVVNGTAVPSAATWYKVHQSVYNYSYMQDYAHAIRFIPYGFWAIVILMGIASRLLDVVRGRSGANSEKFTSPSALTKAVSWLRRHLLLAPTLKYHHHQPRGWFNVPLRLQSVVIASYIVIHIALSFVNYPIMDDNYYYPTRRVQILRYSADRLGRLMSATLPLLFLFGGRGNIFILLTGWSFRTFNIFHRWIGIVLLVEGVLHGVLFSAYYVNLSGWSTYREKLSDEILVYGIMATTAMGIAAAFGIEPLRRRAYEVFKTGHVVFAAVFLAGYYQHVKTQFSGMYKVWTWICVGIWSADHVLRLIRALVMNYKMILGKGTAALASYSDDTGMIRLQVYPSTMPSRQTPGVHYFLYFPGWRVWESHPFSVAGRSEATAMPQHSEKTGAVALVRDDLGARPYLTFIIRPKTGMTRRLRDSLQATGQRRVRVLLDGPYGSPALINRFNNVLIVAGGCGITAVLPYIRALFEEAEAQGPDLPNVQLAWVVREEGFARDVLANDLAATHASSTAQEKLQQTIYITGACASPATSDSDASKPRTSQLVFSRPDIRELVDQAITAAEGSTAVFVCGPGKMADDARAAVRRRVGERDVELFEEMYGW